ncbi:HD-GYP domain-containing protein [Paenibacillus thalictri]|nr:HD-GYP domain-containing protein [Paenibacillus thalictri]
MEKKLSAYCAVGGQSGSKKGIWIGFAVTLLLAAALNIAFPSTLMHVLYIVPIILLATLTNNIIPSLGLTVAVILLSMYLNTLRAEMLFSVLGFIGVVFLIRRLVMISQGNNRQRLENEEMFMSTIIAFSRSIDARDPYTAFHSKNVAQYARKIAIQLDIGEEMTETVYMAGLIHDIGKIGTPEHILHKEARLTEEEYDKMKQHAEDGYQIIKDIKRLREMKVTEMVRHHHERYDGKGYPSGLKGEDIPLGARILAVSDAFDAMTTNRSYRQKLSVETAAAELERHSGSQFDPAIAEAMLKVLQREQLIQSEEANLKSAARLPLQQSI